MAVKARNNPSLSNKRVDQPVPIHRKRRKREVATQLRPILSVTIVSNEFVISQY